MSNNSQRADDFLPVMRRYASEGVVFQTPVKSHRYCIEEVDDSAATVIRVDAREPSKATLATYFEFVEKIRTAGGLVDYSDLSGTTSNNLARLQGNSLALLQRGKNIVLTETLAEKQHALVQILDQLRVDKGRDGPRLYKPAVVAAVIEGVGNDELKSNAITFEWVAPRAIAVLDGLGIEATEGQIAYAFYHLTSDLFWMLCYDDPKHPLEASPSPAQVRERVRCATIRDSFWEVLQHSDRRREVLASLKSQWFDETNDSQFALVRLNAASPYADKLGTTYQFTSNVPNHKKLLDGALVGVDRRVNGGHKYLLGYGRLLKPTASENDPTEYHSEFASWKSVGPVPIGDNLQTAIAAQPSYNVQHAIKPISKSLHDLLVKTMLDTEFCVIGTWRSFLERAPKVLSAIEARGGWATWWSFVIPDDLQAILPTPFWLYINTGGGSFEGRMRVDEYKSMAGSQGIESPWPDLTDELDRGRTRRGEKKSGLFKTWFRIAALERLSPPLDRDAFEPASPWSDTGNLLNQSAFGFATRARKGATVSDLELLEQETLWPRACLEELIDAIRSRGQVVLAGPPGTGKTWVAEHIAKYLAGDRVRTVQFHPSYGYEEFIEGLRPVSSDGKISFEVTPGVVLGVADEARQAEGDYVLIIDEMNRANLPRVFGELMYLFENRERPMELQYSESFALPRNLRFIGTMNTADRSIRSIDIALRRRFEVFECPPDVEILKGFYGNRENTVSNLFEGFVKLNELLTQHLDRHHAIGQTFFMVDGMNRVKLKQIWERQLSHLIEEYFFDQPDLASQFTLEKFWGDGT